VTTPTIAQLTSFGSAGPGFSAESPMERLLTVMAMLASNQNPDGTVATSALTNPAPGTFFVTGLAADSGVTDNGAALLAMQNTLPNGGTIYISPVPVGKWIGVYNGTSTGLALGTAGNVQYIYQGSGAGSKVNLGATVFGPVIGSGQTAIFNLPNDQIVLRDMTIFGDCTSQTNVLVGINVNNNDTVIENVYAINCVLAPIWVQSSSTRIKISSTRTAGSFNQPGMGGAPPTTNRTNTTMAITSGSTTITDTTGSSFTQADVGLGVNASIAGVQPGTRIASVTSATSATMDQKATATIAAAGATFTIMQCYSVVIQCALIQIQQCRFTAGASVMDTGYGCISDIHFENHLTAGVASQGTLLLEGSGGLFSNCYLDGYPTAPGTVVGLGGHIIHKTSAKNVSFSNMSCTNGISALGGPIVVENQGAGQGASTHYGVNLCPASIVQPGSPAYTTLFSLTQGNNLNCTFTQLNVPDGSSALVGVSSQPTLVTGGSIGSQGLCNYAGVLFGSAGVYSSVLAATLALPATTATTVLSVTLPIGLYLVLWSLSTEETGGATFIDYDAYVALGTATGSIIGGSASGKPTGTTVAAGQDSKSGAGLVTVTAQGTILLVCFPGTGAANFQAQPSTANNTIAGATSLIAIQQS
jgi:hypothetical protein